MSIPRITSAHINEYGVVAEPDILSGTPAQNKSIFDRLVREKVAPSLNAVIDEWEAYHFCEDYNPAQIYRPLNRVMYNGTLYECLRDCSGVTPPNFSFWKRVSPAGGGDMNTGIYDPNGRKTDVFALADSLCVDLGVTSGTNAALVLPAPPSPLCEGARVRYKTHMPLTALSAAQTLKIGNADPLPVYAPFRGATTIPAGTFIEAVYTGSEIRVCTISASSSYGDTGVPWTELTTYIGSWEPALRVCKINGIVYLQGAATQNLDKTGMIALIPAGLRPKSNLRIACSPGSDVEASYVVIQASGLIYHEYRGIPWQPALCVAFPSEA